MDAPNSGQPAHKHIRFAYPQVPMPHPKDNVVTISHQKMGNVRHETICQTNDLASNIRNE